MAIRCAVVCHAQAGCDLVQELNVGTVSILCFCIIVRIVFFLSRGYWFNHYQHAC